MGCGTKHPTAVMWYTRNAHSTGDHAYGGAHWSDPSGYTPLTDDGAGAVPANPSPAGDAAPPAPSSPLVEPIRQPRLFELYRHRDINGLSGTGTVAWGAEWPDGTASLRWFTEYPSTVAWDSVDAILAVHGHSGATEIRWLDGES